MAKEKNYNPVQEAKKAEKQKQIRKQKANLATHRNGLLSYLPSPCARQLFHRLSRWRTETRVANLRQLRQQRRNPGSLVL
jgi:hypothetical protein